ncbi:nuclear transport factor 2 family protein [Streptomyces andamanensis]|uniref:Nuclear transport factor 2 family protein n=1 Tax=Streptomyces andamanensis TaxID=1565035 RepID=A0ABV8TIQ9_9ACTN
MGKIIDHTDEEGRAYREVDRKGAPEIGVEVRPDEAGSWDVRLTVRRFRFSPAGTAARPVSGRGLAHLLVDGRLVGRLHAPEYRLSARLVPRGTHHVTARLYADDDTVWAVSGRPVQSTADITASDPHAAKGAAAVSGGGGGSGAAPSGRGAGVRSEGGVNPSVPSASSAPSVPSAPAPVVPVSSAPASYGSAPSGGAPSVAVRPAPPVPAPSAPLAAPVPPAPAFPAPSALGARGARGAVCAGDDPGAGVRTAGTASPGRPGRAS